LRRRRPEGAHSAGGGALGAWLDFRRTQGAFSAANREYRAGCARPCARNPLTEARVMRLKGTPALLPPGDQ
jgi:hypothetical protein